jgi:dipeptidyl aminopeptidase/acylaminoacyl peptidase
MPRRAKSTGPALLLAALALAACTPPDDPFGSEPVLEPELFAPGAISTPYADEVAVTFTPDGREAYFTRGGGGRGAPPRRIYVSRFIEGAWTAAEPAPFSRAGDETPFLTADGGRLLFSSRRDMRLWGPVRGNGNLWMVERTPGGWSEPVPLPGEVNKPRVDEGRGAPERSESGPVLLEDGTLLYWTSEDADRGADLYMAERRGEAFVDPRPLRLNTSGAESHPALSPDGRYLVFQAFRDIDAVGEQDLYVSERTDYGWATPRVLPEPINSPDNDGYPSFSPDGRHFFFASERAPDRSWSIYHVETGALGLGIEGAGRANELRKAVAPDW